MAGACAPSLDAADSTAQGGAGGDGARVTGGSTGSSSAGGPTSGGGGNSSGAGGATTPGGGGVGAGQGGSGGTGVSASGGSSGAPPQDGGQGDGATTGPDPTGGDAGGFVPGPITECTGPSIDRLQQWLGHNALEGVAPLSDTSILVSEAGHYVAKAKFTGADWSEIVVRINNAEGVGVNLSQSSGFTVKYSATADLWFEFRGTVKLHGGDQYGAKLPATGGAIVSKFISFDPANWAQVPGLDQSLHAFADVLKTASIFDVVGHSANTVAFYSLRFDKFQPPCK